MKTIIKVGLWTLVGLVAIQFVPIDKTNKPVKKSENFVDLFNTPKSIKNTLKKACYDCHSNETIYPEYAMFAPVSWAIVGNVNKGRKHLNFSEWATFNKDIKMGMIQNLIADIEQNRMPKQGYIAQHPEAKLSEKEKLELIQYFNDILEKGNY